MHAECVRRSVHVDDKAGRPSCLSAAEASTGQLCLGSLQGDAQKKCPE